MKCFLHIGTEKTATTTIQEFFYINRKILQSEGFAFSQTVGRTCHRLLALMAYNDSRRDDITLRQKIDSGEALRFRQAELVRALKEEVRSGKRHSHSIIFSSEHVHSRLTKVSEILRLKEILLETGITDIIVIVYLRRPASIAASLYSTSIKAGDASHKPPAPSHSYWNNVCHHQATLERYSNVFGENKVVPRVFDKKTFPKGSIILDILAVMDVPSHLLFKYPRKKNERLSTRAITILKYFNKRTPQFIFGRPNPFRMSLVKILSVFCRGEKYAMPPELYEQYEEHYKDSNEWVRTKYFPEKERLFGQKEL